MAEPEPTAESLAATHAGFVQALALRFAPAPGLAEHIRVLAEDQDVRWHDEEETRALRQCLDRLPDKSRQLVKLHYFVDLTSVDIAARMAMNADAVRRALFRLRGQLRKCIQNVLARA